MKMLVIAGKKLARMLAKDRINKDARLDGTNKRYKQTAQKIEAAKQLLLNSRNPAGPSL